MGLCHRRNATWKALAFGRYKGQHGIKTHTYILNLLILALRSIITAVASGVTHINVQSYRHIFNNNKNNSTYQKEYLKITFQILISTLIISSVSKHFVSSQVNCHIKYSAPLSNLLTQNTYI